MLVVIAIMGVITGAVIANYAAQRQPRDLKIAQSQLVSKLRQLQSYTLSARNVNGQAAAQYYVLKIDASSTAYSVQAIRDSAGVATVVNIETVQLPHGIHFATVNPIVVERRTGASPVYPSCVLMAFRLPFARTYTAEGCSGGPGPIASGDDYRKMVDFVANSATNSVSVDSKVTVTLSDETGGRTRQVTLWGTTGVITFN